MWVLTDFKFLDLRIRGRDIVYLGWKNENICKVYSKS